MRITRAGPARISSIRRARGDLRGSQDTRRRAGTEGPRVGNAAGGADATSHGTPSHGAALEESGGRVFHRKGSNGIKQVAMRKGKGRGESK